MSGVMKNMFWGGQKYALFKSAQLTGITQTVSRGKTNPETKQQGPLGRKVDIGRVKWKCNVEYNEL